jgi:transglutaminase-like putative cysteine protease
MFFDPPSAVPKHAPRAGSVRGLGDVSRPTVALLSDIPDGIDGTKATLRVMRSMVRDAVRAPDQLIRGAANQIIKDAGVSPRNWSGEIRALHSFVRDHIRYVRDPVTVELVQTPEKTLELGYGDCDDKSTLLAAMLDATGHPARFWAVGFDGQGFSHVLVEALVGETWVPLETILDVPVGWRPPGIVDSYRLNL